MQLVVDGVDLLGTNARNAQHLEFYRGRVGAQLIIKGDVVGIDGLLDALEYRRPQSRQPLELPFVGELRNISIEGIDCAGGVLVGAILIARAFSLAIVPMGDGVDGSVLRGPRFQITFDGRGNYTLGLKDQLVFPEIDYTRVDKIKGMNITLTTTAKDDEQGRELLKGLGVPLREKGVAQ